MMQKINDVSFACGKKMGWVYLYFVQGVGGAWQLYMGAQIKAVREMP